VKNTMLASMKKRKKAYSFILLLMLLLVLAQVTAGRQGVTTAEKALLTVMAPVQGVFQRLTRSVESVLATVKNYQIVLEENQRLNDQLASVFMLQERLDELRQENNRLRQMLDYEARSEYQLVAAEVIARDPSDWFHTITINRGSVHGIEERMAVVTSVGLVGSVLSVSPLSSQVLLITDAGRGVSAFVQRSREPGEVGVVDGDLERPGYLRIERLPRNANLQPGDTIITSGLGGIYPKGLVIGYVLETLEDGISQQATLQPAANFNRLEEVFVVIVTPGTVSSTNELGEVF
jgi:rod shape-determining protein MreC